MSSDLSTPQPLGENAAEPETTTLPTGMGAVGVLDLTSVSSFDALMAMGHIGGRIGAVGTALVPVAALAQFTTLPIGAIGTLVPVRLAEAGAPRVRVGEIFMSGDDLAGGTGNAEDILLVQGQLVVTSPVTEVGYREIIVVGQLLAPASSRRVLEATLSTLAGQAFYYKEPSRLFTGEMHLGQGFFDLVAESLCLVILGTIHLDADVTVDILRAKVAEIVLIGTVIAPRPLIPILQFLTTSNVGTIEIESSPQTRGVAE